MSTIQTLQALEILDSRGRPTIKAWCRLANGLEGAASVPSGASTGQAEALELRDGDPKRYRGLGCRQAVAHINELLHPKLSGCSFQDQGALDRTLLELDGTRDKRRLGANAVLAVSLAFARAQASEAGLPLYEHLAATLPWRSKTLPRPTINLFSGGKHAGAQAPLQDILMVPVSARTMDDALAMSFEVYHSAAELVRSKYQMRLLRADEGGLAPPFKEPEAMLEDAMMAIESAGLRPGKDVALAVDAAASHFYRDGRYRLSETPLTSGEMIGQLVAWVRKFPIVSLEDGLAEDDWNHWPQLREELSGRCLVLGDDLLCTNPDRIQRAIRDKAADALLLKVNQIGTLTEALDACRLARSDDWRVTISARSGETEDNWLADLAVAWGGDQIKIGSITQSDRLSKYNRLLEIEAATHWPLVNWPERL